MRQRSEAGVLPSWGSTPGTSRTEWLVDMALHGLSLTLVAVGIPVLLVQGLGDAGPVVATSLLVYCFGLLATFICSTLYNAARSTRRKALLQRLDHAAIFLMIAGTYTPFAVLKIGATTGTVMLATIWGLAVLGIALKLLWPDRGRKPALALYLGMGWSIVFALGPLLSSLSETATVLLFAGGIAYTAGVGFYVAGRLRFHNEIWHLFVLAGAVCHYAAIFNAVVPV